MEQKHFFQQAAIWWAIHAIHALSSVEIIKICEKLFAFESQLKILIAIENIYQINQD